MPNDQCAEARQSFAATGAAQIRGKKGERLGKVMVYNNQKKRPRKKGMNQSRHHLWGLPERKRSGNIVRVFYKADGVFYMT